MSTRSTRLEGYETRLMRLDLPDSKSNIEHTTLGFTQACSWHVLESGIQDKLFACVFPALYYISFMHFNIFTRDTIRRKTENFVYWTHRLIPSQTLKISRVYISRCANFASYCHRDVIMLVNCGRSLEAHIARSWLVTLTLRDGDHQEWGAGLRSQGGDTSWPSI